MAIDLSRTFEVEASAAEAWRKLADLADWPTWAKHIRAVEATPPGPLGPTTTGLLRLKGAPDARFTVTAFEAGRSWSWRGKFLWLTIDYDHVVEEAGPKRARITFSLVARGFAAGSLGRLFRFVYRRKMDRAIENLIASFRRAG